MAESVTIPRCVWADRPAGDERSANNLHQSKAGAGQRSASCHMLARPEHRCVWPYGGFICRACSKTGEARQILAAGKKAKMEALAQRLNLDTNALAMRVKANASMVAAKATKAAQLAEEADDWWAGTAATAQKRKAKERGGLSEKQGENSSQPGPSELPEAQVTVNVEAAQRAKGSFKVVSRSSEEGVQTMATSSSSSPVPPSPASERFVL